MDISDKAILALKPSPVPVTSSAWTARGPTVISERPEHASRIMALIACWSNIEHLLTEMFAHLIGGDRSLAAELLGEVRKWTVRRAILLKYSQRHLTAEGFANVKERLDMNALREMESIRNDFAHGIFVIPDAEDAIWLRKGYGEIDLVYYPYTIKTLDCLLEIFHEHGRQLVQLWTGFVVWREQLDRPDVRLNIVGAQLLPLTEDQNRGRPETPGTQRQPSPESRPKAPPSPEC